MAAAETSSETQQETQQETQPETRHGIGVSPGTAYGPVVQVAPPVRPPADEGAVDDGVPARREHLVRVAAALDAEQRVRRRRIEARHVHTEGGDVVTPGVDGGGGE